MADQAVYLYCFTHSSIKTDPELVGIGGRATVGCIEAGEVAAIYSVVPLEEFTGEAAEKRMTDPAWVVPRACKHEQVTEEVMKGSPVLPVRFGTVFASPQALARLLAANAAEIARFLDYIADKEEWSVKFFMDAETAAAWRAASDPLLAEKRARMSDSPGARYLQEKQLRTQARRQARHDCVALTETIQAQLEKLWLDFLPLKLQDSQASGRIPEMILNGAVLLYRDLVVAFRDLIEETNKRYVEQGLAAEAVGPWPPYHFCATLENVP
jgi:hypothetical protein